jgi:hypothetical protein
MDWKKYYWVVSVIVIIILIIFFYPKQNNIWDDTFTAHSRGQFKNMDCTCIGFTKMEQRSTSDTQVVLCYGLPVNCKYSCKKIINGEWQTVSCDLIS